MAVNENVINNVVKVVDEATPKLQQIGDAAQKLGDTVERAGASGSKGLDAAASAASRLDERLARANRGGRTTAQLHKELATIGGLDSKGIAEFERRVGELLPLALSKAQKQAILAADSFEALDEVAEKILIATTKRELFGRAVRSKDADAQLLARKVVDAKTMADLEKVEAQLNKIENKASKTGDSLKKAGTFAEAFAQKLGGISKSAEGLGEAGIGAMLGSFLGNIASDLVEGVMGALQNLGRAISEYFSSIKDLANGVREVVNTSISTGLSAKTLQGLKYAAATTGIEVGSLQNGMEMLSQSIVQTPEKFEAVGISVRNTTDGSFKKLDEILPQLADKMTGLKDKTGQLYIAQELLGQRIGGRILPVFVQGGKAFDAWGDAAMQAGQAFSKEDEARLLSYANSVSYSAYAWEGAMNKTKLAVTPFMQKVEEAKLGLSGLVNRFIDTEGPGKFFLLNPRIALSVFASESDKAHKKIQEVNKTMSDAANGGAAELTDEAKKLMDTLTNFDRVSRSLATAKALIEGFKNAQVKDSAITPLAEQAAALAKSGDLDKLRVFIDDIAKKNGPAFAERVKSMTETLLGFGTAFDAAKSKAKALAERLAGLKENLVDALGGMGASKNAQSVAKDMLAQLAAGAKPVEIVAKSFSKLKGDAKDAADALALVQKGMKDLETRKGLEQSMFGKAPKEISDAANAMIGNVLGMLVNSGVGATNTLDIAFNMLGGDIEKVKDAVSEMAKTLDEAAKKSKTIETLRRALDPERFSAQVERIAESIIGMGKKGASEFDIYAKALAEAGNDTALLGEAIDAVRQKMEKLGTLEKTKKRIREYLADQADAWSQLGESVQAVLGNMTQGVEQFFNKMIDKAITGKDMFSQIFKMMAQEAIAYLTKVFMSKLFMFILGNAIAPGSGGMIAGVATGGVAMPTASAGAASLSASNQMPQNISNTTNNRVVIQTLSPRDVVMDMTRPGGSLRSANTRVTYAREY